MYDTFGGHRAHLLQNKAATPCNIVGGMAEVFSPPTTQGGADLVDLMVPVQPPDSLRLHAEAILLHSDKHLPQLLDTCCPIPFGTDKIMVHERNDFVTCSLVPCLQCPAAKA